METTRITLPFNSLYWDFCFASPQEARRRLVYLPFNSLYWDFCFASSANVCRIIASVTFLSIPFIGIFALHQAWSPPRLGSKSCLSIPFIGIFALHPERGKGVSQTGMPHLSIPFIGIFALHLIVSLPTHVKKLALSIPFIGIFALHHLKHRAQLENIRTFNSLYWDFCFASTVQTKFSSPLIIFQFPLLGFLLCIQSSGVCGNQARRSFNSLYWDFCFASGSTNRRMASIALAFQFPLLGFLLCIPNR